MDIYMIVLAGGKGTRMKTDTPKCLYPFHYKPMINYLINAAKKIQIKELGLIIGYQQNLIKKAIKEEVTYIYQEEPLGTGHAIKIAKEFYNKYYTIRCRIFQEVSAMKGLNQKQKWPALCKPFLMFILSI